MLGRKSLSSAGPVCSPVILLPHNVSLGYSLPSRPRGFSVLSCLKLNCQHIVYFWRNLASLLAVSLACKEVKWKSRGLKLKDLCPGVNLANHCLRYHLIGPHLLTSFWVPDPFYNLKRTLTPTFTLKSAFTPKHIKLCILCPWGGGSRTSWKPQGSLAKQLHKAHFSWTIISKWQVLESECRSLNHSSAACCLVELGWVHYLL